LVYGIKIAVNEPVSSCMENARVKTEKAKKNQGSVLLSPPYRSSIIGLQAPTGFGMGPGDSSELPLDSAKYHQI
jgi:hypothetical protein